MTSFIVDEFDGSSVTLRMGKEKIVVNSATTAREMNKIYAALKYAAECVGSVSGIKELDEKYVAPKVNGKGRMYN